VEEYEQSQLRKRAAVQFTKGTDLHFKKN